MKFSIITPIYNEENLIEKFFYHILNLNYNLKNLEIIFVNDGSTDNSKKILEKIKKENQKKFYSIKIFNNKNFGRVYTRNFGAEKSSFQNLVFLDVKCYIEENSIQSLKKLLDKKKENCVIGNIENKFYKNNISSRISYLFHKKFYSKFENFNIIKINENNFDNVPKGAGILFIDKIIFLKSTFNTLNKNISDDTKILYNILKKNKNKIIKFSKFLGYYYPRKKILDEIKHTFNRGPKFIDYYFSPSRKYFYHIIFFIFGITFFIFTLLINIKFIFAYLILGLILNFIISIYLSEKIKDYFICFIFCPIFIFSFFLGLIKGILLKIKFIK